MTTDKIQGKIKEQVGKLNGIISDQNEEISKRDILLKNANDEIERLKNILSLSEGFIPNSIIKAASDKNISISVNKHQKISLAKDFEDDNKPKKVGLNEAMSRNY